MPFLQAGFNYRHRSTGIVGWTRHVRDERRRFMPAELIRFVCGDFAWLHAAKRPRFLAWGEVVVLGSWGFQLPLEHQFNLPQCDLDTRRERGRWINGEWMEPQA